MRIVKWILGLVLLWSLFWAIAAFTLRTGITGWFDLRQAEGWQAEMSGIETGGYPWRHQTRLVDPLLADPQTGRAWSADSLLIDSPAIWPGRQTLRFAETPQYLSYFDDTEILTARNMAAKLDLEPGLALELKSMGLTSDAWSVATQDDMLAQGSALQLTMTQDEESPETYQIVLDIPEFAPGPRLRRLIGSASTLPDRFDALETQANIRFDRPWDRRALENRRPQPTRIELRRFDIIWGPLKISAAGRVDVDEQGLPEGIVNIRAENWRDMLRMAQSAGALPQAAVQSAERALGFLAGLGGRPETLDVQLNLSQGMIALGPLPLGPAPRLRLR